MGADRSSLPPSIQYKRIEILNYDIAYATFSPSKAEEVRPDSCKVDGERSARKFYDGGVLGSSTTLRCKT